MPLDHVRLSEISTNTSIFPSFALCTANRQANGDIQGESFLILNVDEKRGPLFPLNIHFNARSFLEAGITLDESLVLDECLAQGLLTFNQTIWHRYQQGAHQAIMPSAPVVKSLELDKMLSIWASWRAQREISAVHNITANQELKSFLSSIMKVTPYTITPISSN